MTTSTSVFVNVQEKVVEHLFTLEVLWHVSAHGLFMCQQKCLEELAVAFEKGRELFKQFGFNSLDDLVAMWKKANHPKDIIQAFVNVKLSYTTAYRLAALLVISYPKMEMTTNPIW